MDRLISLLRTLRGPDGCPWDRAQTPRSLAPFLLEETYELLDAISLEDEARIREELGDVLLHVVFQAHLAEDRCAFSLDDVIEGITRKLTTRHAHILSNETRNHTGTWETEKLRERGRNSVMDGVPRSLPALLRAWRCQQRASEVGFDWPDAAARWGKIVEEIEELAQSVLDEDPREVAKELGDVLFSVVAYGRHLGIVAEEALHEAVMRFSTRFRAMEELLVEQGTPVGTASLSIMEAAWQAVKAEERSGSGEKTTDCCISTGSHQESPSGQRPATEGRGG